MCQPSIAFVAEGDAETRDCWSGCAQGFVQALRDQGAKVRPIDVQLRGAIRWGVATATFHPVLRRWRRRFALSAPAFGGKSAIAARRLRSTPDSFDLIIQAGATFVIPRDLRRGAPLVVYADSNVRYAWRGRPHAGVNALTAREAENLATKENRVYAGADRIWSWSHALSRSFVDDFGQPADKVLTIFAGANLDLGNRPPRRNRLGPPSILFVGKDHQRKGLPFLLAAFSRVRATVPDAQLHVVGTMVSARAERPGVISHGFIPQDTTQGRARLRDLYGRSTVFCLPSRYEPFGVVFIEAMLAGLPCIGVDRWAMPEIIADGETGWLVPDGDSEVLAARVVSALENPERSATMGEAGRRRAMRLFTWDRVAERALSDLKELLAQKSERTLETIP